GPGAGAGRAGDRLAVPPGGLGTWVRHRGGRGAAPPRLRRARRGGGVRHDDGRQHPVEAGDGAPGDALPAHVHRAPRRPAARHRARRGRVPDHPRRVVRPPGPSCAPTGRWRMSGRARL
ncbi:MAG: Acetyltransferase, GNAT family, partial [uncultured Pseudonocardia sp.]